VATTPLRLLAIARYSSLGQSIPVNTCGIGVPDIDNGTLDGLAGVDIDVLHLQEEIDTVGVEFLPHILPHELTPDVVGAVSNGRSKDGAGVSAEDVLLRGVGPVVQDAGLVVVNGFPLLEGSKVAAPLLRV
jgi:hypothetical protein